MLRPSPLKNNDLGMHLSGSVLTSFRYMSDQNRPRKTHPAPGKLVGQVRRPPSHHNDPRSLFLCREGRNKSSTSSIMLARSDTLRRAVSIVLARSSIMLRDLRQDRPRETNQNGKVVHGVTPLPGSGDLAKLDTCAVRQSKVCFSASRKQYGQSGGLHETSRDDVTPPFSRPRTLIGAK